MSNTERAGCQEMLVSKKYKKWDSGSVFDSDDSADDYKCLSQSLHINAHIMHIH